MQQIDRLVGLHGSAKQISLSLLLGSVTGARVGSLMSGICISEGYSCHVVGLPERVAEAGHRCLCQYHLLCQWGFRQ